MCQGHLDTGGGGGGGMGVLYTQKYNLIQIIRIGIIKLVKPVVAHSF